MFRSKVYIMFTMFRETIQENVDMIKLQREVKEKASKLQAVESKYLSLNEVHGYVNSPVYFWRQLFKSRLAKSSVNIKFKLRKFPGSFFMMMSSGRQKSHMDHG